MRSARTQAVSLAVSAALVAAVCSSSSDANAAAEVSGSGKGIAGGALLGAEIGFLGLSAFGAKQTWTYYTIPPLLAVGGGVGGYFIEQNSEPEVPIYMLAAGMALVIPTVVITLSANAYRPSSEDSTPADAVPTTGTAPVQGSVEVGGGAAAPAATGGATGGAGTSTTMPPAPAQHKPKKTSLRDTSRTFALVDFDESTLRVGIPLVHVKPAYTQDEIAKFGLAQRYEVHAPVVNVAF